MIYAGAITEAAKFLQSYANDLGDLDAAPRADVMQLGRAARTLIVGVQQGVIALEAEITASGTLDGIESGTLPWDGISALQSLFADINQLDLLVNLRGYAGRVEINVRDAG